jgi:hypothetical protein
MEKILMSSFVAVESAHAFSAFLPSVFTIQSLAVPQGQEGLIRAGYIPAILFSLMLSYVVSHLVGSRLPLYFGAVTCVFMVLVYEWALSSAAQPTA